MDSVAKLFGLTIVVSLVVACSHPSETDVSSSAEYNFSHFAGTTWKTKVKVAVARLKQYTNVVDLNLLVPKHFDASAPEYTPAHDMEIISVLPPGTVVRVQKLVKDNGEWGGVRVLAHLDDGTYSDKNVYLDPELLQKNKFIWPGYSSSDLWGVNPDMLESMGR